MKNTTRPYIVLADTGDSCSYRLRTNVIYRHRCATFGVRVMAVGKNTET